MFRFGGYELDATQGLSRAGKEVRLTPKSLAVLWLLAERAGRVVTKDDLFEIVWADTAVTDSALATCIQEIRHALEDDARTPRFIETIHRRGYRFVARTSRTRAEERPAPVAMFRRQLHLIGRDTEVRAVLDAFDARGRGRGRSASSWGARASARAPSSGECSRHGASGSCVTWAQCVEQYGSGEPYQPLLDALMRLCRQPGRRPHRSMLERFAPMWLAQLPGLLRAPTARGAAAHLAGASRDRMLRELTNVVEAISGRIRS